MQPTNRPTTGFVCILLVAIALLGYAQGRQDAHAQTISGWIPPNAQPTMQWTTTLATSGHGFISCWDQAGETTTCADVKRWDPGSADAVPDGDLPFFAGAKP